VFNLIYLEQIYLYTLLENSCLTVVNLASLNLTGIQLKQIINEVEPVLLW